MPEDERRLPVKITPENAPYLRDGPELKGPEPGILERMFKYFAGPSNYVIAPAGIALNEKTVPTFLENIVKAPSISGDRYVDQAIAFLKTRYPRYTSQVPQFFEQELNPGSMARFKYPALKADMDKMTPHIEVDFGAHRDMEDLVNSITHELMHARQYYTIGPEAMQAQRSIPYLQQPIEQQAGAAGNRGGINWAKFKNLLRTMYPPPSQP